MKQRKKIGKMNKFHNIKNHKKIQIQTKNKKDFEVESLKSDKVRKRKTIIDYENERQQRIRRERELIEFANRIKAPYWWIFKERFYWITGVVLYLTFSIVYFANTDTSTTVNKVYSMMLLQGVSAMCMAFSMVILNKIVSFFYL